MLCPTAGLSRSKPRATRLISSFAADDSHDYGEFVLRQQTQHHRTSLHLDRQRRSNPFRMSIAGCSFFRWIGGRPQWLVREHQQLPLTVPSGARLAVRHALTLSVALIISLRDCAAEAGRANDRFPPRQNVRRLSGCFRKRISGRAPMGSLRLGSSDRGGGHRRQAAAWPVRAGSILAMSIRRMVSMASIARFAAARFGSFSAAIKACGTICHEKPQRSLHQLHAPSLPPFSMIAFQWRSVSA
jgi:hypothetical protein